MSSTGRTLLLTLIAASIALQLASASLLKYASLATQPRGFFLPAVLVAVFALNFGRLVIWNHIHKRFPISMAYPLSALFFPGVLLVAWTMGESLSLMQIIGGVVVTCGIVLILVADQTPEIALTTESHEPR